MPSELKRFLLIYSSQTGQAKAIAEEIAEKAPDQGFQADVHCISETEKRFWIEREKLTVIITSTTGDGDPPDTANKFWRRLKKKTLERNHLSNLRYSLMGLGDSNYSNFCNCAKNFDRRLKELGAVSFLKSSFADDAVGLEQEVEPWMEALFPALRKELYADQEIVAMESCVSTGDSVDRQSAEPVDRATDDAALDKNSTDKAITVTETGTDFASSDHSSESPSQQAGQSGSTVVKSATDSSTTSPSVGAPLTQDYMGKSDDSGSNLGGDGKIQPTQISSNVDSLNEAGDPGIKIQGSVSAMTGEDCTAEESLTRSVPPLSESGLTLPALPAAYLKLSYTPDAQLGDVRIELQNSCPFPSAKSEVSAATITKAEQLTTDDAIKKTLKLSFKLQDTTWEWAPGDSFGILCSNDSDEVDALMKKLGVEADTTYLLEVIAGTKKRSAAVPPHIPPIGTLRQVLTHCCDIRSPPKKALLRSLVDCCLSPDDKRRLQELCSKQGAESYTKYLRQTSVSILDIFTAFPSCSPPVERLLEHLPRLQPRPYSAASSPVVDPHQLDIVFNVVNIPAGEGRSAGRQGICTGLLDKITADMQVKVSKDIGKGHETLAKDIEQMSLKDNVKVSLYLRNNQHFRPPTSLKHPVIMIGPGTGVAPFIGFLQERENALVNKPDDMFVGECWLLYGCRHQARDYLFRKELAGYENKGVLSKLLVCFSRDEECGDGPRYVQDMIRLHSEKILSLIMDSDATVYVCGDAQGMARGVSDTLNKLLQEHKDFSEKDALEYMKQMRLSQRYKEDVWT